MTSSALSAPARSAYRQLWRASSWTFAGDAPVLTAFRQKMRTDAGNWRTLEGAALDEQVQLARDVAKYLRENLAQIRKVEGSSDMWRLSLTEHHEIGDNTSIKNPPPIKIPPKGKRLRSGQSGSQSVLPRLNSHATTHTPSLQPGSSDDSHQFVAPIKQVVTDNDGNHAFHHVVDLVSEETLEEPILSSPAGLSALARQLNYSQLKKVAKQRVMPELDEDDLEESFVRGHGPGGQSINKTNNNVQLIHRPTGIRVVCQHTRSLALNRMYARRILLEKLDKIANPGLSKGELQRAKQVERERRKRKKAKNNERDEEDRARRKALRKEEKKAARAKNEGDGGEDKD